MLVIGRLLLAAALVAVLNGCAMSGLVAEPIGAAQKAEAAFQQRLIKLRQATAFDLQGRIAVKGGALSGSLRWSQWPDRFSLRVAGPFGAGALLMDGRGGLVHIKNKDVDITTADPETLLAQHTGWRLPLNSLRYWVLGIPAPDAPAELEVDALGRALSLRQSGWTLHYSEYLPELPGTPGRVEATREDWTAVALVQTLSLAPAPP